MSTVTVERVEQIRSYLDRLSRAAVETSVTDVARAAALLETAYLAGRTIFTCGNGGSAATASHLAVDLAKNTRTPGAPPVRTMSLVDHIPALTAWANDVGYPAVFRGQLEGMLEPGDVLVAVSTSGNSPNVVNALRYAREAGGSTVGLLGRDGGEAYRWCDAPVTVPAAGIDEQEDLHVVITHILTRHLRACVRRRAVAAGGGS